MKELNLREKECVIGQGLLSHLGSPILSHSWSAIGIVGLRREGRNFAISPLMIEEVGEESEIKIDGRGKEIKRVNVNGRNIYFKKNRNNLFFQI